MPFLDNLRLIDESSRRKVEICSCMDPVVANCYLAPERLCLSRIWQIKTIPVLDKKGKQLNWMSSGKQLKRKQLKRMSFGWVGDLGYAKVQWLIFIKEEEEDMLVFTGSIFLTSPKVEGRSTTFYETDFPNLSQSPNQPPTYPDGAPVKGRQLLSVVNLGPLHLHIRENPFLHSLTTRSHNQFGPAA